MKINLIGQRNILGGGIHFSNFSDSLKKLSAFESLVNEWDVMNNEQLSVFRDNVQSSDINIFFFGFSTIVAIPPGLNIVWAIFESDTLDDKFISILDQADLVWVPSNWGLNILIRHGLDAKKIIVIPEGVNPDLYHPYIPRSDFLQKLQKKFQYLIVGKYEERKGYTQLLQAFSKVTKKDQDINLLIKADYFLKDIEKRHSLSEYIKNSNADNITTVHGKFSSEELVKLYHSVDAYVFPSRAEGWGLPLIEAIACGVPVIATNYSGHSEYLSKIRDLYIPVNYKLVPIKDMEFQQYWAPKDGSWGNWAEVDVNDLSEKLLEIKNNYEIWQKKALKASEIIRNQFSWDAARDKALSSLMQRGLLPKISVWQSPDSVDS
jgi:glycosyltransferase involved in cell wall biosynthesis